ncbi:MAG: GFA family protein [Pseudohongiella sp.]|uniref:GFA family protein n=1 Tax=Pseudohongiella sp. TaxID=1979412 RepID=UPI0034A00315
MQHTGRCQCGNVQYELSGDPKGVAICHCRDCQRSAGAPMVVWAMFPEAEGRVTTGEPKTINSSGTAMRSFCPECGTGLFYQNAVNLPGIIDVQASTLDNPDALPPAIHIQTAERQSWYSHVDTLPAFERFPEGS